MDSFDLAKLLQKGFYVTLGATASLLEVIQDPRKAQDRFDALRRDLNSATEEFAEKGAVTESEARNLVDNFVAQQIKTTTPSPSDQAADLTSVNTVNTTATTVVDSNVQADLQELTQQLADLRTELEKIRQSQG